MLFLTNRIPKGSIRTRVGRRFEFDLNKNSPGNSIFFCRHTSDGENIEVGGTQFMSELKTCEYSQILLFIHGFSNLPKDVFEAAEELQSLCNQKDAREVLVVPVIWPCDNDFGIVGDYWDDQKSADSSSFSFARALDRFLDWRDNNQNSDEDGVCLKRINILAHSMGNRVLRETLVAWDKYDLANGVPLIFKNIFLVAADIENESIHRTERARLICDASRNVVVYFASDDLALRASKAANLKNKIASRRLGHTGPENILETSNNVYTVDCDDINTAYDNPTGHSYFMSGRVSGEPGLVFDHIYACIKTGRVLVENIAARSVIISEGMSTH